jgi:hypothetical protein
MGLWLIVRAFLLLKKTICPYFENTANRFIDFKNHVSFDLQEPHLLQQLPQLWEHPMHFFPFFFALITYTTARVSIKATADMIM